MPHTLSISAGIEILLYDFQAIAVPSSPTQATPASTAPHTAELLDSSASAIQPTTMQPYQSRSGNGGVVAFNLGENSIDLEFRDGSRYRYDASHPGPKAVAQMQQLAQAGAGLTTFVNRNVRNRYAAKLPPNKLTRQSPPPSPAQSEPETPH